MARSLRRSAYLPVLLLLFVVSCGDDSTGPGGSSNTADFSGTWEVDTTVIARRICDIPVDSVAEFDLLITQSGSRVTVNNYGRTPPFDLSVSGNRATGSSVGLGESANFDLTIEDGALSGEIIRTVDQGTPCTETSSVAGTRVNAAPSAAFAGSWDLELTVTSAGCSEDEFGEVQNLCVLMTIDGSTVSFLDEDGLRIEGVGDGNSFAFRRLNEDGELSGDLTIQSGTQTLTGDVFWYDAEDQCTVVSTVVGTKRDTACPPPPEPGDFDGQWTLIYSVVGNSCFSSSPTTDFVRCAIVTSNGTSISFDDGVGSPLQGSIEGNRVELFRDEAESTFEVEIRVENGDLVGEAFRSYTQGECAEQSTEYEVLGLRRSQACGVGDGQDFDGYWSVTGTILTNECEIGVQDECTRFVQVGNTVVLVGEGLRGSVSGNTLTIRASETSEIVNLDVSIDLTLSGAETSFNGIESLTLSNPSNASEQCTSTISLSGTRVGSCNVVEQGSATRGLVGATRNTDAPTVESDH